MAALYCSKCGAVVRDDGTFFGGEDNCGRRDSPQDHNFVPLQVLPQQGMRYAESNANIHRISFVGKRGLHVGIFLVINY